MTAQSIAPEKGPVAGGGGGGAPRGFFGGDGSRIAADALQDFGAFGVACPWGVGLGAHGSGSEGECPGDGGGQVEGVGGRVGPAGAGAVDAQGVAGDQVADRGGCGDTGGGRGRENGGGG